jgi:hypothetical protein
MAKYFVESSEIVIYRTMVEAETPQEAMEKIEKSNGEIVDRVKDVSMRHDLEAFAVYDEDDNEVW